MIIREKCVCPVCGDEVLSEEVGRFDMCLDCFADSIASEVTESVLFDMGDVARGGAPADSVMPCPFCGGLDVICAAAAPVAVGKAEISYMIKELGGKYEFILLDCPAGLGETLSAAAKCADAALLVTTPAPAAVRAARSPL